MERQHEDLSDVIGGTLATLELDREFDGLWEQDSAFTIWTTRRVYFPAQYDGEVWCASVARFPDGIATDPVGVPQ